MKILACSFYCSRCEAAPERHGNSIDAEVTGLMRLKTARVLTALVGGGKVTMAWMKTFRMSSFRRAERQVRGAPDGKNCVPEGAGRSLP